MGKRNFLRVPQRVRDKVAALAIDDCVVAVSLRLDRTAVERGDWAHLDIAVSSSGWSWPDGVVPPPERGRFSRANVEGLDRPRRDLPKVDRTFTTEMPNWGDWSRGSHDISYTRRVWQREFFPPLHLPIRIESATQSSQAAEFIFRVGRVLNRTGSTFEKDLLFDLNLMQENVGSVDVFASNTTQAEFLATVQVDWELLPPGTLDETIDRVSARLDPTPEERRLLHERLTVLRALEPRHFINGVGSFARFFGAQFENDLVVLENLELGNALYVMYEDWQELSKRSRIELLNGQRGGFDRIVHSGAWQRRLRALIRHRRR